MRCGWSVRPVTGAAVLGGAAVAGDAVVVVGVAAVVAVVVVGALQQSAAGSAKRLKSALQLSVPHLTRQD